MSDSPVGLSRSGPPETILPPEPADVIEGLAAATAALDVGARREALRDLIAGHPTCLEAWARLGDDGRDTIESYAYYRVGYHRGLDRLRANGWRGSGFVRWEHPTNRGFLRAVAGLERCAAAIGEVDEQIRCAQFLQQLDPRWDPAFLTAD